MDHYFILIVEDHYELAQTLCEFLETQGYLVDHARNLATAKHLLEQQSYHLVLLDINLPDGSGYMLCQWLRQEKSLAIPVLMLTARDQIDDKLQGFAAGTDDYLVKPFDFKELVARVQALLKRALGEVTQKVLHIHDLVLDHQQKIVVRAGKKIELPPIQFKLLHILMRHSPNVITKQDMIMTLWGDEEPESDTLRSYIYHLRKLIDKPFEDKLIHTVSGVGLRLAFEPFI